MQLKDTEKILYAGNLDFSMTEKELTDLFCKAGHVNRVQIVVDRATGQSRGYGFVEMGTSVEAEAAITKFNHCEFNGRSLTVTVVRSTLVRPFETEGLSPHYIVPPDA